MAVPRPGPIASQHPAQPGASVVDRASPEDDQRTCAFAYEDPGSDDEDADGVGLGSRDVVGWLVDPGVGAGVGPGLRVPGGVIVGGVGDAGPVGRGVALDAPLDAPLDGSAASGVADGVGDSDGPGDECPWSGARPRISTIWSL